MTDFLVSPKQHGALGGGADDTAALQATGDFCAASKGAVMVLDDNFRCSGPLTSSGGLTIRGAVSSGNNSGTNKSTITWDLAPETLECGLQITGQNWSIEGVALNGSGRARRVLQLEAASVGRLRDSVINGPAGADPLAPGACIWGFGLINVAIEGCTLLHNNTAAPYARGIDVQAENSHEKGYAPGVIYYGFDNASAIRDCRIYGHAANIIADGGTYTVENCDFQGWSVLDDGKVILSGTSTQFGFTGNYAEFKAAPDGTPHKTPMKWVRMAGSNNFLLVTGNRGYMVPTKEPGSICFDLGQGNAYYRSAIVKNNAAHRFESGFTLRPRATESWTEFEGNSVGQATYLFAPQSYYKPTAARGWAQTYPGRFAGLRAGDLADTRIVSRTEGATEAGLWVTQAGPALDLTYGNLIYYNGAAGATLGYIGTVPEHLAGATFRIFNGSDDAVNLAGGNGKGGTFLANAGSQIPAGGVAVVTALPTRVMLVETITAAACERAA